MMLEPDFAGDGEVEPLPFAGGFQYQEGIVGVYAPLQYLAYLHDRVARVDEP